MAGPAGRLQIFLDRVPSPLSLYSSHSVKGLAIVCHPHTIYGGTMNHKVVTTLSRTFQSLNFDVIRFNFRGAGQSEGRFDNGFGEQSDLASVIQIMAESGIYKNLSLVLAGFSFGAYVVSSLVSNFSSSIFHTLRLQRLVLVGVPAGKWNMPGVPSNTIIVHGEKDEIIPLENVLLWGAQTKKSINVIEDADHFFHCKLHLLKEKIIDLW